MIKQRRDSIAIYEQAGRTELAEQEAAEIAVIEEFLPKQMGDAEADEAIAAVIKEVGAASQKDMGKVMAALKAALRRPDGLRQGQRPGEGAAEVDAPAVSQHTLMRNAW